MGNTDRPPVPLLGESRTVRLCDRTIGKENGQEIACGKPAVVHIAWYFNPCVASFSCPEHATKALNKWSYFQVHLVGPDCGMPGAVWDGDEERCLYPGEELPVRDTVEEFVHG